MSRKHIELTEELVLSKTKAASLLDVKSLSLWGLSIEKIDIISRMVNLETVALSTNHIKTLEPFSHCPNLHELYVRRNDIENLQEIQYLKNLPKLQILWLSDNPISEFPDYRSYVIKTLPQITILDEREITNEERLVATRVSTPQGSRLQSDQIHKPNANSDSQKHLLSAIEALLPALTDTQRSDLKYEVTRLATAP